MLTTMLNRWWLFLQVLITFCFLGPTESVKHENFKTCSQSGFCKRNRAFADKVTSASQSSKSPYSLDPATLKANDGRLEGRLLKTLSSDQGVVELPLTITFQDDGIARITVDEKRRQKGDIELRHGSQARKERYNEAASWALIDELNPDPNARIENGETETIATYGPGNQYKAIIRHSPFEVDFVRNEEIHVKLNSKGFMNMEHWRPKVERGDQEPNVPPVEDGEDTWWEESFGGNTDSKPRGPESVGIDICFPQYEHVYGIPGHASSLSLKETRGTSAQYREPYRLYNSDVFEYEMDSPMTLYGAIPLMYAHKKRSSVGVFWLNAAETWVDISKEKQSANPLSLGTSAKTDTNTHWFSESGLIDVFVFLGPQPRDIIQQFSALTGYTQLPQLFSIGHHQCRWNYVTDEDVKDVDRKMTRADIPYDVIWLDIEYTDGKKYFTWDEHTFPNPLGMQDQLDISKRKLVVIIDPHIKNEANYPVVDELKSKDLAVKNKEDSIYEGWCWPGSSHWVDCFNPAAIKWWTSLYKYASFKGTTPNTFIWNDMNEPSVFNGPETTMPKDNLHHGNWEHRDVHNINGMTFHNATYQALLARDNNSKRPFVLTRSYFAGSQRLGAMWTGDNQASWSHLAASIPMLLSMNIAGFPFAGADVGGFFQNPSKELLTRWYQAGAFYPFFRAHAHIDTRRREPYLVGEPYTQIITQALRLRYALLPAWYTAFHTASSLGLPILRPHYFVHPADEVGFALEDQFYVGDTGLLIKPAVDEGATSVSIYLPVGYHYFDYYTYKSYVGDGKAVEIAAPLEKIPILMKGGHIFPRKDRPRRSSALMKFDPYTLVIVLDKGGNAQGNLYIDDGESFDYQKGAFIHRHFDFSFGALSSTPVPNPQDRTREAKKFLSSVDQVKIERLIVINALKTWQGRTQVGISEAGDGWVTDLTYFKGKDGKADWAVVSNPGLSVNGNWGIQF